MAWLMKLKENGKDAVAEPEKERKVMTNFVRKDLKEPREK